MLPIAIWQAAYRGKLAVMQEGCFPQTEHALFHFSYQAKATKPQADVGVTPMRRK